MRPTFLIIEVEPREGISVRKLVLETAKHNVLTAYSGKEGLQMLETFPNVDAVVVHTGITDVACPKLVRSIKKVRPQVPVIALAPEVAAGCGPADHVISSHEPHTLLTILETIAAA